MADYYPLIAKAVAGLDKSTGEARRALYERARTALVTQLRGVVPALSETDITAQRLGLEEAIRKVEAEAARNSRFIPPPERKRVDRGDLPDPFKSTAPRQPPPPASPGGDHDPQPNPDSTLSGTAADLRRPVRTPPDRGALSNDGLQGFRNVVADAENLGEATAQAGRSAREAYAAVPSPSPEFDRLEPRLEPDGLRARDRRAAARDQRRDPPQTRETPPTRPAPSRDPPPREPGARDPSGREPPRDPMLRGLQSREPPREPPSRDSTPRDSAPRERTPRDRAGRPPGRDIGAGRETMPDFDVSQRNDATRVNEFSAHDFAAMPDFAAAQGFSPEPEEEADAPRSRKRVRRRVEAADDDVRDSGVLKQRGRLLTYLFVAIALVVLAGALVWEWQPMVASLRGLMAPSQGNAPVAQRDTTTPRTQKFNDRIGSNDPNAGAQAGADVAQRVVLYEEDPDNPAGKRFVGSAVWHMDTVAGAAGQPPDVVVRADIDIPERKMTMKWTLQRNSDKTLPASHTVEVVFTLPQDFPHGGVQNVPGVMMKETEELRGVPLAGTAVKVTEGYFLIGLSAVDSEMQRNIALLKGRPWFDVPIVYNDGRRAILAVEKGNPGDRAFTAAFTAWKQ
jgi:hypothetical protein